MKWFGVYTAAVIIANNHPSGIPEPNDVDKVMRVRIKKGLAMFDMRTLAHFTSAVSPRCPLPNGGCFDRRELRSLFAVIYVELSVAACSLPFGIPTVCAAHFYCL
ncbi:JAB domain-containing protein [Klebsiella quasipneumoniae]|uniref:JAB domain-containing protein n=1 Tax=Enterobacterales TaxID=91347 RepID=UPI0028BDFB35|nr:JAB domain-containing protein [Yersinia pseudotuberculosis]